MYTYSTVAWTQPKYAAFVPYITVQYRIPWKRRNSAEMGKFRSSAQNSVFRRKLWSLGAILMEGNSVCLGITIVAQINLQPQDSWMYVFDADNVILWFYDVTVQHVWQANLRFLQGTIVEVGGRVYKVGGWDWEHHTLSLTPDIVPGLATLLQGWKN